MAKFSELNKHVYSILLKLIEDQDLCKLLLYSDDDPLSQPDIDDTSELLFNKIYPIPKIPDVQSNVGSFVTVLFEDIRSGGVHFKGSILSFRVISHIDTWRMSGALRPYAIMNRIDSMFNGARLIGIGKTEFDRSSIIQMNDKYFGYRLDYRVLDFS